MDVRPPPTPVRIGPPQAPSWSVPRPEVIERLAGDARVVTIIAPPGYGKTEVARQWFETRAGSAAWLTLDLLDRHTVSFWRDLIAALRSVVPEIDEEPQLLLAERGPADLTFLAALVNPIQAAGRRGAIVLDDVSHVTDRAAIDGLALLVARIGHLVRFVVVGRTDPALPLARWRATGWLHEVRADDLRFSDDEAVALAGALTDRAVGADVAVALNDRAEGWPAGLHLALLSVGNALDPASMAEFIVDSDHVLSDYLVAEVLDRLPGPERAVALALSVLEWFDADFCADFLGADAVPIADELRRRQLFLTMSGDLGGGGVMRFHRLFRKLLETELRWRDPRRRIDLHRRAAELWKARGNVIAAYHHLVEIGDIATAFDIVLPVALAHADRGDIAGLNDLLRSLPPDIEVAGAGQAFDFSATWFLAGNTVNATRWCDRAEHTMDTGDPRDRVRLHACRSLIAMLRGDLSDAMGHADAFARIARAVAPSGPIESRLAVVAARAAVASRDFGAARSWVEQARRIADPEVVTHVAVPAVHAALELETGDLGRASQIAAEACASAERLGVRPYHGAIDALVVAARCQLAIGDLRAAEELAESARIDADQLGWPYFTVHVGVLLAEIRRLRLGPAAALDVLADLRRTADVGGAHLANWLDGAEALALIGAGRYTAARTCIDRLDDTPPARLVRAQLIVSSRSGESVASLLDESTEWTVAERLDRDVLVAGAQTWGPRSEQLLTDAVELGRLTGWVSPFLGHGDGIERLLRRLPLERLHPALHRTLRGRSDAAAQHRRLIEPLTRREMTVLELLPTHLSYTQIGERLFLSVNTIKTNLKSTYRKLGVSTRAEAVDAAIDLGLLAAAPTGEVRAGQRRPGEAPVGEMLVGVHVERASQPRGPQPGRLARH